MEDAARSAVPPRGDDDSTGRAFGPAGTQTLVRTPATADPLSALPERASGNLPERAAGNLLVVAARDHPSKLERRLERSGRDASNVGVVPVVPGARAYEGDLWTTDSVRPDDLTGLGMRFSDAIRHVEEGTGWVLVDALGVLLTYADDSRVCRFFQTLTNRVRARKVRGVYCANPDAINSETYERLRAMCDAEYEIE